MRYVIALALAVFLGVFLSTSAMAAERADQRDEAVLKAALNVLLPKKPEEKPPVLIVDEITALIPTFQPPKGRRIPRGGLAAAAGKLTEEDMDSLFDASTKRNSGGGTNMVRGVRASLAGSALGAQVVVSPEPKKVMNEFNEKHGFPKSWIEVSLPGYSADGKRAVVSLQKKEFPHAEREVFHGFFEKHNGEWMFLSMTMYSLQGQNGGR